MGVLKKFPVWVVLLLLVFAIALSVTAIYLFQNSRKRGTETKKFQEMESAFWKNQTTNKPNTGNEIAKQYLDTNPEDAQKKAKAEYYMATTFAAQGDNKNARLYAEKSVATYPDQGYEVYFLLADQCKILEDKEAAIRNYQKVVDIVAPMKKEYPNLEQIERYALGNIALLKKPAGKPKTPWGV